MTRKTASNIDSTATYWSSSTSNHHLYPTPSRDRGGLYPESSKHAQQRAWSVQSGKWASKGASSGRNEEREQGDRAIALSYSTGWTANEGGAEEKEPPDKGERKRHIGRMDHASTIKYALERIIDLHSPTSPPDLTASNETAPLPEPSSNTPSPSIIRSSPNTISHASLQDDSHITPPTPTPAVPTLPKRPPPLPPILTRLVKTRHYRLAVFHVLNNPHLASDYPMVLRLANMLELKGAGELASRLRGSVTRWKSEAEALGEILMKQKYQLVPGSCREQRHPAYWYIPTTPTDRHRPPPPASSPRLTAHLNAHLSFLLRKPSLRTGHGLLVDEEWKESSVGEGGFPPPRPNLRQLRQLLYTIQVLERKYGFKPNRVTANIILGSWLRCASPKKDDGSDPYVFVSRRGGEEDMEMIPKVQSGRIMGQKEAMMLFRVVSMVMTRSVRQLELHFRDLAERHRGTHSDKPFPTGLAVPSTTVGSESPDDGVGVSNDESGLPIKLNVLMTGDGEWEIEHHRHVRPFASMMLNAMRHIENMEEERRTVMLWEKEMRKRLELVGEMRYVLAQADKLDQQEVDTVEEPEESKAQAVG